MGQPVRRFRTVGLVVLGVVLSTVGVAALVVRSDDPHVVLTPEQQASPPYHDGTGLVVALSSEDRIPFRFLGETTHQLAYPGRFVPSVQRFDTVLSCLKENARGLQRPSLGAFDWDRIDTDEDARVCLFRIATSYATIDDVENWMRSQGLTIARRMFDERARGGARTLVTGVWPIREKGPLYRKNMLQGWLNGLTAWGQSVSVDYREGLGVYSTSAIVTRE